MISFIVIGLNRLFFLKKCFDSILKFTNQSNEKFEIIYVDSGSVEDNLNLSKKLGIKSITLTGDVNSAIARNVGAFLAKGDYFIFMDGDMILNEFFAKKYINKKYLKNNNYFSGDLINYFYNDKNDFLYKEYYWRKPLIKNKIESTTGGLFCISKNLWNMVGGMRNYYRRTQDNDFGLRLAKKQFFLERKKELFVIHQTISYTNKFRLFNILLKGDFYYRGLLYREHIFNKNIFNLIVKTDYSLIVLFVASFLAIFFLNIKFLIIHLFFVLARSIRAFLKNNENIILYYIYIYVRDFQVLLSFLFFFPNKNMNFSYKILNNYEI